MKYINPHRWDIFFLYYSLLCSLRCWSMRIIWIAAAFQHSAFITLYYHIWLWERRKRQRERERGRERDLQHFILIFTEKPILWKLILISINRSIAISFKQAHHVEVEVFFHPVCSRVKLFKHLHDVKGIQSIHYGCSFYASCKKKTE